jgi:hypothetical protein
MTRESTDVDTAEQVIDSFRILAADKVGPGWAGLGRAGQGWAGLGWAGLGWTLAWARVDSWANFKRTHPGPSFQL